MSDMTRALGATIGLALLAAATSPAQAPGLASIEDAKRLAESALVEVTKGEVQKGFAVLEAHWPLPKNELDLLVLQTVQQRALIASRFGKSLGIRFASEATVADTLYRATYLEKFENTCIRWTFVFYKADSSWQVNRVGWDDKVHELVEAGG